MAKEELQLHNQQKKYFKESGGIENVASVTHCRT